MNGTSDIDWMGLPTERYGFSNNRLRLADFATISRLVLAQNRSGLDETQKEHVVEQFKK
jgi:uncharacterized protein (DUF2141 family)